MLLSYERLHYNMLLLADCLSGARTKLVSKMSKDFVGSLNNKL